MIYLDNAATTKPSKNVLDAYLLAQTELWGNPSAIHSFGEEVFFKLKNVRDEIKKNCLEHKMEKFILRLQQRSLLIRFLKVF